MFSNIFYDAKAIIKGGREYPKIHGTVYFNSVKNGVLVTAKIYNLPKSKSKCNGRFFGFHIHEGNSCTGNLKDEFANSKGHYNPTNCSHPFHAGDLPPLLENDGYAYMCVFIWRVYVHIYVAIEGQVCVCMHVCMCARSG